MNLEKLPKRELQEIVVKQQGLINQLKNIKEGLTDKNENDEMSVEIGEDGEVINFVINTGFTSDINYKIVKEHFNALDSKSILKKLDIEPQNKEVSIIKIYKRKGYWSIKYQCKETNSEVKGVMIDGKK